MTSFAELFGNGNTTTADLIDKAVENYRELLEEHFKDFDTEAVQTALGQEELATEQFAVFCRRIEAVSVAAMSAKAVENGQPKGGVCGFDPDEHDPYDLAQDPFGYPGLR